MKYLYSFLSILFNIFAVVSIVDKYYLYGFIFIISSWAFDSLYEKEKLK
jgi:hypothetical protein